MGFVDAFSNRSGFGSPIANSITPATPQEVALISAETQANDNTSAPVDGTWTRIGSLPWYWKLITSTALISTSQTFVDGSPSHVWASLLTLFGSNGLAPIFAAAAVGTQVNPGPGKFLNLAAPYTFAAGDVGLIGLNINQPASGFATSPETFIPSDTLGLGSWTVISAPGGVGGNSVFAQLFLAIATGMAAGTTQVRIQQSFSDPNPASFNTVQGFVTNVKNLIPVKNLRLLASLGVGI